MRRPTKNQTGRRMASTLQLGGDFCFDAVTEE